jgi:5-methylcytosine-specific restriction endonuclease McrA
MTPDPKPPRRVKDPAALRAYRLEMSGEPCMVCERRTGTQAHHVTFRSQGGGDVPRNLMWLCLWCHDDIHAGRAERYLA